MKSHDNRVIKSRQPGQAPSTSWTRSSRGHRGVSLVLPLVLFAVLATSCTSVISRADQPTTTASPLTGSVTTSDASWAVVLMGKNDGKHDLFWQLFRLDSSTGRWSLATPRGVADNGGLSVAAGATDGGLLVGFETSQALGYSPLALTNDNGTTWTPGGLTQPIISAPSSVALGPDDSAAALEAGAQPAVVTRSGSLTDWKSLISLRHLESLGAAKPCEVDMLTAAAFDSSGDIVTGVSCRRTGVSPVLVDTHGRWTRAPIPVPVPLAGAALRVLRLGSMGPAVGGLVAGTKGRQVAVEAIWATSGRGPWAVSHLLELGSSTVVASGTGPGATQFVLIRHNDVLKAEVVGGPDQNWHALPALPPGAVTVAYSPSGSVSALAVRQATLTVWHLAEVGQSWTQTQSIVVPIAYGSSD
jgi:hypothetical protein